MRFIKNMLNKKIVIYIIAFIVCIVILAIGYNWRVNQLTMTVTVPYATDQIESRKEIVASNVGLIKVPKALLTDNVIREVKDVVGKYANYNTIIPKGSLFYRSQIVEWKDMPDSAWADIDDGFTVVSLPVSGFTMFSNAIYPGAVIDLYYQTFDEKLVYGKLIENIKVIAVKDKNGKHMYDRNVAQSGASAIIFSVNEDLNILLRKALYLGGKIVPVLRNSEYSNQENDKKTVSSAYIRSLIELQSVMLPNEEHSDGDVVIEGENTASASN